mmetsp:Transcript_34327/g.71478  ORF Transcript_34327/g.71478 Transcript_34327/m.71478 type:complete len:136 (+) Transcript_34327:496-903(+)
MTQRISNSPKTQSPEQNANLSKKRKYIAIECFNLMIGCESKIHQKKTGIHHKSSQTKNAWIHHHKWLWFLHCVEGDDDDATASYSPRSSVRPFNSICGYVFIFASVANCAWHVAVLLCFVCFGSKSLFRHDTRSP